MGYHASLFDVPPDPALAAGSAWVTSLVGGSIAVSLCVIAMAFLGLLMLTGRLPLRRGAQVILGCFLLLGSSLFASSLGELGREESAGGALTLVPVPLPAETPLPPVTEDPYSGASLRRN